MKLIFHSGVLLFMASLLFSCFGSGYQSPRYVKLADEITAKTATRLKKQKNLYLIGTGGRMMHDIQVMYMGFVFYQEMDLQTARALIVYAISEYLLDINNNEEIRPYLHEYPFTAKNTEMRIWISNPDGSAVSPDKIDYISNIDGVLKYYIEGPEEYSHQAICKETYEEALTLLSAEAPCN